MNKKQGFSLVEVMVIFTVLSVVLAASIPLITKKVNPVPNKIAHGVYRCIHTDNGLLEEIYSGSRRISSGYVQKCSFNVPKAAQYKVDMYSAGSGGTLFAKVKGNRDDQRQVDFTMANGYGDETGGNPILRPSEVELAKLFNGKYLVQSVYTGDAGDGGNAGLTYESPYEASCGIDDAYKEGTLNNRLDQVKEEIKKLEGYKEIYDKINVDFYGIQSSYWSDIIVQGGDSMLWCAEDGRYWSDRLDENTRNIWYQNYCTYKNISTLANTGNGNIIIPILPTSIPGEDWMWFNTRNSSHRQIMYNKVTDICLIMNASLINSDALNNGKLTYKFGGKEIYKWVRDSYLANANLDSFGNIQVIYDEDNDSEGTSINNLAWEMGQNRGDRRIHFNYNNVQGQWFNSGRYHSQPLTAVEENVAAASGIFFWDLLGRFQDEYNSRLTPEEEKAKEEYENKDLLNELDKLKKEKDELEKEINTKGGLLKDNTYANPTFTNKYGDAKKWYYAVNPTVQKQVENFCKVVFKNYYELSNSEPKDTIKFGPRRIAKLGGYGGKGKYSRLIFRINYNPRIHTGGFTKYLQDLMNPRSSVAYYPVYCTRKNTSTCTKDASRYTDHVGAIQKANDGNSITASYLERANTALFSLVNSIASNFGYTIFSKDIKKLAAKGQLDESLANACKRRCQGSDNPSVCYNNCMGRNQEDDPGMGMEPTLPEVSDDTVTRDDGSSGGSSSSGPFRKLNTTNGSDLTVPYVGWHISGESTPKIVIDTMPTGGKGKVLYVDEANESKTFTEYTGSLDNAHKIFSTNYAGIVSEKVRVKGQDTKFNNIQTSVYKIDAVNASDTGRSIVTSFDSSTGHPTYQEPYLRIKSDLWTKSYQLGQAGKIGNTSSVVVGNLGNQCTFNVPAPGRVYEKGTSRGDLNKLNAMLSTSIQCRNQNGVVYEYTLEGNNYNDSESTVVQVKYGDGSILPQFKWTEALEDAQHQVEVSLKDNTPQQKTWRQTSIWAKIYKKYMVHDNVYDLKSLRVGQAGVGTTLTDKCVARRGQYEAQMRYNLKYYTINTSSAEKEVTPGAGDNSGILQRSWTQEQSHDLNTDGPEAKKLEYQNGDYQGFNCYGVQNSADTNVTRSEFSITTDSDIHKKGIMEIHAGKGGGGAVVITW